MFTDIVRIYERAGKYLVLNPTVPAWLVTNINGVLVLKCYEESKTYEEIAQVFCEHCPHIPPSQVVAFLRRAQEQKLFEEREPYVYQRGYIDSVYLNMTSKCNLNCSYCFAAERVESSSRQIDLAKYKDLLNQLKALSDYSTVTFTGGEPLLSPYTIPVAEYARQLGFGTYLLTNGTLVTEQNADTLAQLFQHVKISMDGSTAEKYGVYRGRENYAKAERGIRLLLERGVDVSVSMVVTRENRSDISAMVDKWGGKVNFMPLFPLGNAREQESGNALRGKEYYAALSEDARIEPFSDIISIIESNGRKPIMKCALGDSEISISASGDVYPCQLLHNETCYLGNIFTQSLAEILSQERSKYFGSHTISCIKQCRSCDFRYICGGACQARHYSETGSLDRAGDFCEYEREGIINGIIKCSTLETM